MLSNAMKSVGCTSCLSENEKTVIMCSQTMSTILNG